MASESPLWLIAMGYPSDTAPIEHFEHATIDYPDTLKIIDWTANLSARLGIDYSCHTTELAEFLHSVILKLYHLDPSTDIDLALEFG